jgi:hypothetical protein
LEEGEEEGFLLRQQGAVAEEGRDKQTARQGSFCPRVAVAAAAEGKDRLQPRRGRSSQTQSSLETCLGEMTRIAAPVATVKAITKGLARAVLATKEVTTREVTTREVTTREGTIKEGTIKAATTRAATPKAAQTREADANATTAKRSPTRMGGHMEPAEGRITPDATGAIQLGGETLDVVICSLLKGFQTTPGPTELVHTADNSSNVWFQILTLTLRFATDYIDSMNIIGFLYHRRFSMSSLRKNIYLSKHLKGRFKEMCLSVSHNLFGSVII